MRNSEFFKNKTVVIVGLARSGVACANLLYRLGAKVKVTDIQDNPQTHQAAGRLCSPEIKIELGAHNRRFIEDSDLIVISPGVPLDSLCARWAAELNIPLVSEIEIGGMLCSAPVIAITGANGKTTVTTLIGQMLKASGKNAFVCGNIGNPFCDYVEKAKEDDYIVLEVSSFQLETTRNFQPKIALILNLTPNHLDRYRSLEDYAQAKKRIFMNQGKEDFLVLNADDQFLKKAVGQARSKTVFFAKDDTFNSNQSAVMAVGKILGIQDKKIKKVFREFKGIPHRLEEVTRIKGVRFVNDSKATTADSAIWALSNISAPLILIAGGRHKGIDYGVILGAAKNNIKYAFLFGEAKDIIASDLSSGGFPIDKVDNLKEAVHRAYAKAKPGFTVLLSPMCSSYDMFKDYEQRGEVFKEIVLGLKGKARVHD